MPSHTEPNGWPRYRLCFHDVSRISLRECCRPLLSRRCNHDDADQHEQCPEDRSQTDLLAAQEISNHHRHHRVHVRVGPDFRRRLMMNQPHVRGKPDDRARHNQVQQRKPRPRARRSPDENSEILPAPPPRQPAATPPASICTPELMTLDSGSGSLRVSADATDQLIDAIISATAPAQSIGAPPRFNESAHKHQPLRQSQSSSASRQPNREPLRPQKNNFRKRHERRDRRQHDRRNARRHTLLRPEQQPVIEYENQHGRVTVPTSIRARSASARPARCIHQYKTAPLSKTASPQKKRRHLAHTHPNRQKCGSPHKINNRERQQASSTSADAHRLP